jgi:hypothetical protein
MMSKLHDLYLLHCVKTGLEHKNLIHISRRLVICEAKKKRAIG